MTAAHEYLKGAVAPGGRHIFLSKSQHVYLVKQIRFRKKKRYFVHL